MPSAEKHPISGVELLGMTRWLRGILQLDNASPQRGNEIDIGLRTDVWDAETIFLLTTIFSRKN